jgi:hypothetical protein
MSVKHQDLMEQVARTAREMNASGNVSARTPEQGVFATEPWHLRPVQARLRR